VPKWLEVIGGGICELCEGAVRAHEHRAASRRGLEMSCLADFEAR